MGSTTTTTGTLSWSTIVDGSSILYLVLPNLSTGSTENYQDYYTQIVAGDIFTWYDVTAFPGRWVSWRTTGVGVSISGGFRFPVDFINYFDNGSTNDVPGAAANNVEIRCSRALASRTLNSGIQAAIVLEDANIGTGIGEGKFKVDNDGGIYESEGGAAYGTAVSSWLPSGGLNSGYQCRLVPDDQNQAALFAGTENTWLLCSTDREFHWTVSVGTETYNGDLEFRDVDTLAIIGTVRVNLLISDT